MGQGAGGADRIELFASMASGRVHHATLNRAGDVARVERLPMTHPARGLAAETLDGEDLQVHLVTDGPDDARLLSIEGRSESWPPNWQINRLGGPVVPDPLAGVAAVLVKPGTGDVLVAASTPLVRFYGPGGWQPVTETVPGVETTKVSATAAAGLTADLLVAAVIGVQHHDNNDLTLPASVWAPDPSTPTW